jgi:hypothetical protein
LPRAKVRAMRRGSGEGVDLILLSFGSEGEAVVKISDSWVGPGTSNPPSRGSVPRLRDRWDHIKITALVELTNSSGHGRKHGGSG